MRSRLLILTASLTLVSRGIVIAQPAPPDLKIDRMSQDDGLPTVPVTNLTEDENGFLWLSTWNGLYRFDGYSFKPYQFDPLDSTSISSDWVSGTVLDHDGRFWVGTHGGGLNWMNRLAGRFGRVEHSPPDSTTITYDEIVSMMLGSDGRNCIQGRFRKSGELFDGVQETVWDESIRLLERWIRSELRSKPSKPDAARRNRTESREI